MIDHEFLIQDCGDLPGALLLVLTDLLDRVEELERTLGDVRELFCSQSEPLPGRCIGGL